MKHGKDRYFYCAVCGQPVPGSIYMRSPEDSGYGYGKLCACSMAHQMVLVRKYRERDVDRAMNGKVRKHVSDENLEKILRMKANGRTAAEIALEIGCSVQSVYHACRQVGETFKRGRAHEQAATA